MRDVYKLTVVFIFACAAIFLPVAPAFASTAVRGLALSPPRREYDIAPGASKTGSLQVTNGTGGALDVTLDAEQFSVTDQQYDYAFKSGTDVSKWATFSRSTLHLAPGQQDGVDVTVAVPKTAEPGGYYISLFATSDAGPDSGGIHSIQRVASLLYITVGGKVSRAGNLKSLDSPLWFDGYNRWNMTVADSGTTHFRSNYRASVKNIFTGQEVAATSGNALILPNTVRAVTGNVPVPRYIGVYKVVYTVGLGDTPAVTREFYMLFLPRQTYVPLVTLAIVVIGGIIYALIRLRHRRVHD